MSSAAERIDRILSEGPIGMATAARLVGHYRQGKPCHPATITRWCLEGVKLADGRTVKLESIAITNRKMTSRPALLRFLAAQQDQDDDAAATVPLTPTVRERMNTNHERELDALGVA